MPRVSDDYRRARRDEIALAALRCLEREGVHETSIADIVEESGLSTGAIYSHFTSKSELARYIVSEYLFPHLDQIVRLSGVTAPRDVLVMMLRAFTDDGLPPRVVLQFWAEATVDAELHDVMTRTVSRMRTSVVAALLPWARQSRPTDAAAAALANEHAIALTALAQGYIAHTAVFGPRDSREYIDAVAAVLA